MNIFLIGYRCTGKSVIGRFLSNKLAWPFIDADLKLIEEYGMTISEIVKKLTKNLQGGGSGSKEFAIGGGTSEGVEKVVEELNI